MAKKNLLKKKLFNGFPGLTVVLLSFGVVVAVMLAFGLALVIPAGCEGPTGPAGEQGTEGPAGTDGTKGEVGSPGTDSNPGINNGNIVSTVAGMKAAFAESWPVVYFVGANQTLSDDYTAPGTVPAALR